MPIKIPVTNFKMKPANPSMVDLKEFEFSYTDHKGKEKDYKVEIKNTDRDSFIHFFHAIADCKKMNALPWTQSWVKKFEKKITIINKKDDAVQMELPLRVAKRFAKIKNIT